MNTYPTSDIPLGSTSPKVLYNNASNFDEAMNSQTPAWFDRFGNRRETFCGMEQTFYTFLASSGFESVHLTYVAGTPLTVNRPTQLIDYNGSVYRVKMPSTFPLTLSGNWTVDSALLVDVGDASLRQDLANPARGASMVAGALRSVPNIAALKALPTSSASKSASTEGYYAAGDGGAGDYYVPDSFIGLVANGGSVIAADDGGFWLFRNPTKMSLRQYGVKFNSSDDSTAQIQAIFDDTRVHEIEGGSGVAYFTYLTWHRGGASFRGPGKDILALVSTSTDGDAFTFDTGASAMSGVDLGSFTLHAGAVRTSGYMFRQVADANVGLYHSTISGIRLSGTIANGFKVLSTVWCVIDDLVVDKVGFSSVGIHFEGSPTHSASNCMVSRLKVTEGSRGANSTGLLIGSYSEGNYWSKCTFESDNIENGVNVVNSQGATDSIKNHFFDQLVCDSNSFFGLRIQSGRTFTFSNCWFCSSSVGVDLSGCFDIRFSLGTVSNNRNQGVFIHETASDIYFDNVGLADNSTSGVGAFSAVYVNFGANDFSFVNCNFERVRGSTKRHKYSVEIAGGGSQGYIIANNNLRGWITAAIYEGGATTNKIVAPNITL